MQSWLRSGRTPTYVSRRLAATGLVAALTLGPNVATAQPGVAESGAPQALPPAGAPPAGAPPLGADELRRQARLAKAFERFNEGVSLYEEGEFQPALAEFERAYELVPHYQVLYNIGRANFQLGQLARARQALELYLELGQGSLPAERVEAVQADLVLLRAKTATLSLTTNVADASVVIDAVPLETTQWADIVIDAGVHVLHVTKPGYASVERNLRVRQGEAVHLIVQLTPLPLASPLPVPVAAAAYEQPEPTASWLPWAATGVLAAGWLTATALAVQAQADKDELEHPATSPARLDAAVTRLRTLAIVSDVLLGATLAGLGVSAYLTWMPQMDGDPAPERAALEGWGVSLRGEL